MMILYVKMKERKRAVKTAIYHSPFGNMELSYEEDGVISLRMAEEGTKGRRPSGWR